MMPSPTTPQETARQTLGRAIKFFRDQRRLTQRDVAERVGAPIGDVDDWEKGRHAPPPDRWSRLCKMLHDDLTGMRATWQRAHNEDVMERGHAAHAGVLTAKPFANLGELLAKPTQPPKLAVVPPAPVSSKPVEQVPETLHDDGYDLRPAYHAVMKLPEGWGTAEAKQERHAHARKLIEEGKLTTDEIIAELKRKYGVGIAPGTLTAIRQKVYAAQARAKRETLTTPVEISMPVEPVVPESPVPDNLEERVDYARALLRKSPSLPLDGPAGLLVLLNKRFGQGIPAATYIQLSNEARAERTTGQHPVVAPPAVTDGDVEAAVHIILEAIPNLKSFKIEVDESGEVRWSHVTRKVVEASGSGSMKLKRP